MKWTALRIQDAEQSDLWRVRTSRRMVEVRVLPGPDLVLRLEKAVAEQLGRPLRPPPEPARWSIEVSSWSHGDIFELEQDTVWTVVDQSSGKPLWEFTGGTSHVLEGGAWSASTGAHGVDEVTLGADGRHVLARNSDEVTCWPLPRP